MNAFIHKISFFILILVIKISAPWQLSLFVNRPQGKLKLEFPFGTIFFFPFFFVFVINNFIVFEARSMKKALELIYDTIYEPVKVKFN